MFDVMHSLFSNAKLRSYSFVIVILAAFIAARGGHASSLSPPAWAAAFNHTNYARGQILNADNYVLYWSYNSDIKEIKFAAIVKTMGWVGLGISSNGGMKGADIAILQRDSGSGKLVVTDRWATATATPVVDSVQNLRLSETETKQADGVTHFVFTRKLISCDSEEDLEITAGPNWVIRAFGDTQTLGYHGPENRGAVSIDLLAPPEPAPSTADSLSVKILQPNYTISDKETQYVCSTHVLPNDRKYHVTVSRPVASNEFVHHMILYKCASPHVASTSAQECSSMTDCILFWTGWAVGGQDMVFPPDAGLPMGTDPADKSGGSIYMLLQIHYNNPTGAAGVVDEGSGFELIYTPTLRKYDVGVLTLGDLEFVIPPQRENYEAVNYCPQACTQKFPATGLTVVGNGFHMHELGVSAVLKRIQFMPMKDIRDGTELPPIGEQKFFDFEHQNIDPVGTLTRILPGDRLELRCAWNSMSRVNSTSFGESTFDEMCFDFLTYYPKMDIWACISASSKWNYFSPTHQDIAVCAPEFNLNNVTNQVLLNLALQSAVEFDRMEPYTPLPSNVPTCSDATILPTCGDGKIDPGEECESGDGCAACQCMQGWFVNTRFHICGTEPDFLSSQNGVATVTSWVVAGFLLILLIMLAIIILVLRKRRANRQTVDSIRAMRKDGAIMIEDTSSSNDDQNVELLDTPKVGPRQIQGSGSEDEESDNAGTEDSDDDSLPSRSSKHKKSKVQVLSSVDEDDEDDDDDDATDNEEEDTENEVSDSQMSISNVINTGDNDDDDDEDESSSSTSGAVDISALVLNKRSPKSKNRDEDEDDEDEDDSSAGDDDDEESSSASSS